MGDEVTVKDGYARNFLFPRKEAIEATAGAVKVLEQKKGQARRREQKLKQESEVLAGRIASVSCTIPMEAGEEDKLFGAVTAEMISTALAAEGIEVDKRKIVLEQPIKTIGVQNVEIRLHPEVKAEVRVWVIKK
ncbi:MAG TPA: 50S ribosomal protein L9 [Candidatus Omnitrophota bacterium]|nr:50S ribosomal protein L9 [Candidatus Omnitrophota bacterium]